MTTKQHEDLLNIYQTALQACNGRWLVADFLEKNPINSDIYLIAIGKAAASMAQGAYQQIDEQIKAGLVITKHEHCIELPCQCIESSHPIPDEASLKAGDELLKFIANIPQQAKVLFLLSGGASALVEVLADDVNLTDLVKLNQQLLSQDCDIVAINQQRGKFSKIKHGGLLNYFTDQQITQLIINDVPSNNLADVGSGLLFADKPSKFVNTIELASIHTAITAAQQQAKKLGYQVELVTELLTGEITTVVPQLVKQIAEGKSRLLIAGGELTVNLPKNPGKGGRNQQLALSIATLIAGNEKLFCLAAGTDGTDGLTNAAGAIIDSNTVKQAKQLGFDVEQSLATANAYPLLKACDALVCTGPTGTNVMDLLLLLKDV